jgi:arabinose-5-phosphate isomerase
MNMVDSHASRDPYAKKGLVDAWPDADFTASRAARRTIEMERAGLDALMNALRGALSASFSEAVKLILASTRYDVAKDSPRGRVIVSGMGKSGHIGRKLAATLASTGTPAFFIHSAEAGHGDLGMITRNDVVVVLSWSGETAELRSIVEFSRRFRNPVIAVTAKPESSLARQADIVLTLPDVVEACPHGLAPTTSTIVQLALGDALAIALLEARGFTAQDFHRVHPRGRLGAHFTFVQDIMHRGEALPLAGIGTPMSTGLLSMTSKGFGCLGVVAPEGGLVGIITDGDLRRHLGPDLLDQRVEEIMTTSPTTVAPDMLAGAAIDLLNQQKITAVFVVENGTPVGIVHMHDLLRIGVS